MNKYFDLHFNRDIITIYPGEFCSTTGTELISTVLGSCISIAIVDLEHGVGGMNHFMLAKDTGEGKTKAEETLRGKFGEYAVGLLLEDLLKKGASRKNMTAKIFGGSNVFALPESAGEQVGDVNIKFAFDYLNRENIPILSSDTGGIYPRKIFFDPRTAKVWLKRISTDYGDNSFIYSQEQKYMQELCTHSEPVPLIPV